MATLQKIPGGDNWVLTKVQYTAAEARGLAVEVAFAWLSATAVALLLAALAVRLLCSTEAMYDLQS